MKYFSDMMEINAFDSPEEVLSGMDSMLLLGDTARCGLRPGSYGRFEKGRFVLYRMPEHAPMREHLKDSLLEEMRWLGFRHLYLCHMECRNPQVCGWNDFMTSEMKEIVDDVETGEPGLRILLVAVHDDFSRAPGFYMLLTDCADWGYWEQSA